MPLDIALGIVLNICLSYDATKLLYRKYRVVPGQDTVLLTMFYRLLLAAAYIFNYASQRGLAFLTHMQWRGHHGFFVHVCLRCLSQKILILPKFLSEK